MLANINRCNLEVGPETHFTCYRDQSVLIECRGNKKVFTEEEIKAHGGLQACANFLSAEFVWSRAGENARNLR